MTAKEEREREICETVYMLPQEIPEESYERVKALIKDEALLYRIGYYFDPLEDRKVKAAEFTCTACGKKFYLQSVQAECGCHIGGGPSRPGFIWKGSVMTSGDAITCSWCGRELDTVHCQTFQRRYCLGGTSFITAHAVRGHLALLQWQIEKYMDKEGRKYFVQKRGEGVLIVGRKPVRVTGLTPNLSGYIVLPRWERRMKYADMLGPVGQGQIEEFGGIVEMTESRNCAIAEYCRSAPGVRPAAYLQMWCKWPAVENLVRQGFGRLLSDLMKECTGYRGYYYSAKQTFSVETVKTILNVKETKPHRMIGLEKPDLWIAKEFKLDTVRRYRDLLQEGIRLTREQLEMVESYKWSDIHELTKEPFHGYKVPIVRMLNYLRTQKEKAAGAEARELLTPGYLRDYWNSVFKVYERMEPGMLWPKNLQNAHDKILLKIREKEDEIMNAKFAALDPEREKLCFEDKALGLMIRPAKTHGELITEGKILQHCVSTYSEAMAAGRTTILFIRKLQDPDMPFYTLEWKNGVVQQNRGKRNCARTPEVQTFEKEWLDYIYQKGEGYGLPDNRKHECAGA